MTMVDASPVRVSDRFARSWQPLRERAGFTPWTDDYSTILPLLEALR